ncbi:MAG: nucleotidyltransferase domain-containing protein [Candidatus Brocadiales bacterium]|nr:nucleotidyltransferase domain-containing protein [Candidatus Brocadiales bacterium]
MFISNAHCGTDLSKSFVNYLIEKLDKQIFMIKKIRVAIPEEKVIEFCKKWKVREFALFGSVLRKDFCQDSDIDVLVKFDDEARHTLFDLIHMEEELKAIFGRDVDLVSKRGIEASRNYIRKNAILNSAEIIYAE